MPSLPGRGKEPGLDDHPISGTPTGIPITPRQRAIKAATECRITAPEVDARKIAGIDRTVGQGDTFELGEWTARLIDVGGHTMGHIAYHLPEAGIAFCRGFAIRARCGRMFRGHAPQFWASLSRIKACRPTPRCSCAPSTPLPMRGSPRTQIQTTPPCSIRGGSVAQARSR